VAKKKYVITPLTKFVAIAAFVPVVYTVQFVAANLWHVSWIASALVSESLLIAVAVAGWHGLRLELERPNAASLAAVGIGISLALLLVNVFPAIPPVDWTKQGFWTVYTFLLGYSLRRNADRPRSEPD
jgi:hypothetical protein